MPVVNIDPEERRHLDGYGRGHRKADRNEGIGPAPRAALRGIRRNDELLPEALRVLACELSRERVELTHALDRHKERFVSGEARIHQSRDLLAQMIFQLCHIDRVDRLTAPEVAPPQIDLLLE